MVLLGINDVKKFRFHYHRVHFDSLQTGKSSDVVFSVYPKFMKKQIPAENNGIHTLLIPIIRGNVYDEQPSATSPSFVNGV